MLKSTDLAWRCLSLVLSALSSVICCRTPALRSTSRNATISANLRQHCRTIVDCGVQGWTVPVAWILDP
jgi:hypothetical protein